MMRRGLVCVLGLLCLNKLALGQDQKAPWVPVFCDDEFVKLAVNLSMEKFNEQNDSGYEMAADEILRARKWENSSGSVYSVVFSSRGISPPFETSPCNAVVYMTLPKAVVEQVNCLREPPVVLERIPCLGCPEDIDVASEELKVPISVTIKKFNSINNSTWLYILDSVHFATRQVVAGFRYKLAFDVRKSTCLKDDPIEPCKPNPEDVKRVHCNSTVDIAPWRHEAPDVHIECLPGGYPLTELNIVRRRPPGWSPLRNMLREIPPTISAPVSMEPPSTTVVPKEESSEEDGDTSSKSSSTSMPPLDGATADSFRCPFKVGKNIDLGTYSRKVSPELPIVEGGFSDMDLLG